MLKSTLFCITLAMASAPNLAAAPASGQQVSTTDDWCRGENSGDRESVCEVRQYTIPATGATLAVDARPNGGINVEGTSRGDVLVLAKVVATAETKDRAKQILSSVQVSAAPDKISATGPERSNRDEESWSVSYRLSVPEHTPLSLESTNGGISISKVDGHIEFKTVNGGVKLSALSGEVKGRTSNGGVDVDLDGTMWQGEGLEVQTSNGGVKLAMPANYSAQLKVGTVNGGIHSDVAVPMPESEGPGRRNRSIDAQIGAGGPPISVHTTNGGVRVTKKD